MKEFIKNYKENLILMMGHFSADICQGSVSSALTVMLAQGVLHSKVEMSYLVLASTLVSSLIQPVIGYFSDKSPKPYLMSIGILTAALGLMFIGFLENFYLLFILLTTSGIGVAVFHPQGGKMANCVSVHRKGLGVSIFSVGGNLGFSAGPIVISAATYWFGLPGIMAIGIPAFIMSFILLAKNRQYVEYTRIEQIKLKKNSSVEQESYSGFAILTLMIFFRSAVLFALTTYIPSYFMDVYGQNAQTANLNLSIVAVCSAVASLAGGILADRIGFKKVLFYSAVGVAPCMLLFTMAPNGIIAVLAMVAVALSVYGTLSVSMVLGQKFLCRHVGFASGITIGLGISFGGITTPFYGYIFDHYGAQATMLAVTATACIAAVIAYFVPDIDAIRAKKALEAADNSSSQTAE